MKKRRVVKRQKTKEPLAVRHRPTSFDGVVGQDGVKQLLVTSLSMDKCPKVMLFYGPRGCGKTTVARIVAGMLGAVGRDYVEFNIAHTGGKERAREITDLTQYAPMESEVKVYIFDECHRATKDFQDAMLKVVEEPPEDVYFIFCTTEPERLLPTLRSRCAPFEFKRLKSLDLKEVIDRILKSEGESVDKQYMREIINQADGDCRAAITMLEMIVGVEDPDIDALIPVSRGSEVIELCRALLDGKGWVIVSGILKKLQEEDHDGIRNIVLGYMNKVLLGKDNPLASLIIEAFAEPFYNKRKAGLTSACYFVVKAKG